MDQQLILIAGLIAFLLALVFDARVGWAALIGYCLLRLLG